MGAYKLEGVDATLAGERVIPDGCNIEKHSDHGKSKELEPEATDVSVINHCGCQIITDQCNACKGRRKMRYK